MPIAIDLFAGAGGLSEGLEEAGTQVAVAVELHPQAGLTHAFNHPSTEVLVGDIRHLTMEILEESVVRQTGQAQVDLIAGGPPCQGFSTAGKKILEDPRNNLFRQFVRVVDHFRPKMFLLENVPGFKKMHEGFAYNQAVELLGTLGYTLCDTVLDAADYGVPQRRQRFVMVGWLEDQVNTFEWPASTHAPCGAQSTLFDTAKMPYVTVAEALDDIAFLEPGWECHRYQNPAISDFQTRRRTFSGLLFNHLATRHRPKAVEMFSHIQEGATISSVPTQLRSGKRTMARWDRNSISNAVLALPDDLLHYHHHRIPSVREMARLQSFDDDYVFFGKRTSGFVERRVDVPQYTQVGNAVPPLLAKALGKSIMTSLDGCIEDLREIQERRVRHSWVRGSSGYAGYTLGPEAARHIRLSTVQGQRLELDISTTDVPVSAVDPIYDWTVRPKPRRGQWAPGITPRPVPSHVLEETEL